MSDEAHTVAVDVPGGVLTVVCSVGPMMTRCRRTIRVTAVELRVTDDSVLTSTQLARFPWRRHVNLARDIARVEAT